jgi:hypothetical protein
MAILTFVTGVLEKLVAQQLGPCVDRLKARVAGEMGAGMRGGIVLLLGVVLGGGAVFFSGTRWRTESPHTPATTCDMRIGESRFEAIKGVLRRLKDKYPGRWVYIVTEPQRKDSCLYARDLQAAFTEVGWQPPPPIVDHGKKLDESGVWFYRLLSDGEAVQLCNVLGASQDLKVQCQPHENPTINAWEIYIKD